MKHKLQITLATAFATIAFVGCGSHDYFDPYNAEKMGDNLISYMQKDIAIASESEITQNVYIDLTPGLKQVFRDKNVPMADIMSSVAHKLVSAEWYGMGSQNGSEAVLYLGKASSEVYSMVTNPNSYSRKYAPLDVVINDSIAMKNNEALVISDMALDNLKGADNSNYAQQSFVKWLKKGYSIDFYVINYNDKGVKRDKHLCFVVFNTNVKKLTKDVDEALTQFNPMKYSLSVNNYAISTNYPTVRKGGNYYDKEGNDIVMMVDEAGYINNSEMHYEYYPCFSTWADIMTNAKSLQEAGVPKPFTHMWRNLYIDLQNNTSYDITKLDVRVTNVNDDYVHFVTCMDAKNYTPKMTKDESGNDVLDESNDEMVYQYYDMDGTLKSEYTYSEQNMVEMPEIFTVDKKLFENTYNDDPAKTEIGIVFHPKFDETQLTNPSGLVRVDIIIAECTPKKDQLASMFAWNASEKGVTSYDNLSSAIAGTLSEMNPQGQVIYTYFVKTSE